MTDAQEAPIEQVRLRTAEDLLVALRSPNLQTRAAVLASVMQAPDKALQFGSFQGVDLIDELIDQLFRSEVPVYRHLVAAALSVLEDPRVAPTMRRLLTFYGEPDLLRVAADRLAHEPVEPGIASYRALVSQSDSMLHAQIGADLLLAAKGLDDKTAIRVSVANSQGRSIAPLVSAENVSAWIQELNGNYLRQASLIAESQGVEAFRALANEWARLSEELQVWLVRWGAREFPLDTVDTLRRALLSRHESVILEAIRSVEMLRLGKTLFADEISPLLTHASEKVRSLAISAGARVSDPRESFRTETSPIVQAELLIRLRECEGIESAEVLVDALCHEDYRVRVQAMTELTALGGDMRERAKQMVKSGLMEHKVAGTNLLLAMGDQEWLEENLLG